jgi:hypothetical protein
MFGYRSCEQTGLNTIGRSQCPWMWPIVSILNFLLCIYVSMLTLSLKCISSFQFNPQIPGFGPTVNRFQLKNSSRLIPEEPPRSYAGKRPRARAAFQRGRGCNKISLGPAIPYNSTPYGWPARGRSNGRWGLAAHRVNVLFRPPGAP